MQEGSGGTHETHSGVRSLAILGSSSTLTVIAGIVSAKIAAVLLGPSGVGLVGLAQAVAAVAAAVIELGLATSIVRAVGRRQDHVDDQLQALYRLARATIVATGVVVVLLAAAVSASLVELLLGADRSAYEIVLVVAGAAFIALTALENGAMIAGQRIRSIALTAVLISFVSPSINAVFFLVWDTDGVAPGLFASAGVVFAIASTVRRRAFAPTRVVARPGVSEIRPLLADGIPTMATALFGAATLLVLPVVIDDVLGRAEVGYYRAAMVVSLGCTVGLLAVVSQDFLPRASRVAASAQQLGELVTSQVRLMVSVFVPTVCVVSALLPIVIRLLFSQEFAPAIDLLQWLLVADLARVVGSILATALFARWGGRARLLSESVGLIVVLGFSLGGLHLGGLVGIGVAQLAAYVLYAGGLSAIVMTGAEAHDRRVLVRWAVLGLLSLAVAPTTVLITGDSRARLTGLLVAAIWVAVLLRGQGWRRLNLRRLEAS